VRRAVVDLASPRPVWDIPDATLTAIRRAFGRGWSVEPVAVATSSDGDGAVGSEEAEHIAWGAEVYVGWGVPRAVAGAAAGTLRWAHSGAAGVGASITQELRASGAVLTNSRGVHAEPMADWIMMAMGFCARGMHAAVAAQRQARWAKDEFTDGSIRPRELKDLSVGLVGLGGIGRTVARRCAAQGMEVRGIRRRAQRRRPADVTWVGGPDDMLTLARASDILVLAAPHTARTVGLLDRTVLEVLPEGAFIINVSRGALVDEGALLRALDTGRLGGCVLDVFSVEPLPPDHRFWSHPRVLVSPHISCVSDRFWERETSLIVENIGRYRTGRKLRNVVDRQAGY
jgi:phosphoglycerate dehydrogenase-like enzyme